MGTQNKIFHDAAPLKKKWWYLPMLILGSVMVIGGVVWLFVQ